MSVEEGRRTAALIPGAGFVGLPGNIPRRIANSPEFGVFIVEFTAFLQTLD